MVARVDPRGWITQYEYNARGQQTAVISPSGAVTRSRYDPASQLVETIDPNGSPTVFGYDPAGHLIEATDAKGAIRRFDYDPAGRQKSFTDPLDRITTRAYDANGNLTTITDPSGHAQQFHYDAAKRLLRQSADDGTEVSFSYDPGGRRTSMTDGTGTTHYGYDSANRLLIVTDPAGGTTTASYDAAGQHTSFSYPDGLRLTYQYDRNGHLIFLHDSRAGRAAYVLDPDGRLITEELPRRFARRYHYDQGLLRRYAVFHNDRLVSVTDLGYDPDGRIAAERADADQRTYRYDPAGQLVSARHWRRHPWPWETDEESSAPWSHDRSGIALPEPGHWREHRADAQHWDYDVVGNRTRARRGDSITHYRYDVADQLIVRESHGLRTEYSYDTSGRLTEESIGEHCHRTSYDGFGRPVRITQHGQRPAQRTDLTYTGDNLLALLERTNTDADRDEERAASVRYRWSTESIPQILSQSALPRLDDADRDRPGRLDADFTYGYGRTFASWEHGTATFHTDVLGSNIHTEDTEPWVLAATHYDPFGSPDVRDEDDRERHGRSSHFREDVERPLLPPELPRFGYRGELAIGSDGSLLYLRTRTYNTRLGRFTTPDPMAQMARPVAAVSPYAYADNNPINQSDPMGLWSIGSLVSSAVHGAQHLASSVVHGAQHVANAVSGAVTHAAQVVAGAASHAFHAVVTGLANIANTARKDAGIVFHAVAGAARRVVHAVGDAVSRTVGIATHAVSATVNWVKKHNQILGKIGSVLSNVSGALALAGLLIAPIPGLDFLTPILEGGAALTALGAVGFQGVARAAGDTDITYGDLLGDALGVIPGGGDAKEAVEGVDLAKLAADGSAGEARTFHTVQSAEDAARLRSGGDPWPMEAERAALGPGVYAFDNRESAEAYAQLLGGHGASNLEIMSFSVSEHALSSMRSLNIDSLPDPDLFMSKYSRLWGAIPNHGYDWLMRGTRFGTEHYFSNNVFDLLRFSGGR
jgi:RHS repeat-associated protein